MGFDVIMLRVGGLVDYGVLSPVVQQCSFSTAYEIDNSQLTITGNDYGNSYSVEFTVAPYTLSNSTAKLLSIRPRGPHENN